ncbi:aminoglycoside phosphotransferase family protein [Streptomyces sp. LP11]|uniref:Aminoglycoside phosphotransferase family protein n=1 Tax=Streptomyces pyxinicus TaxID=2970331 RepID=A0ABT2AX66_9ACTN|nr:aminoglycoside phosphotransferase family protein [Streptomyces sp. LP11]MCS0600480.1 aminoglycoside phosphotransferase family protein [Streptomyces sp. LP11]
MIDIPPELAEAQRRHNGTTGEAFVRSLPHLAADFLNRWHLTLDGPQMHGVSALVLPVTRTDGARAVLKLHLPDEETRAEPVALRTWNGDGAVLLLDHDPDTGTLLLEHLRRLGETRPLTHTPDTRTSTLVIARLLARLTSHPAPPGLRSLGDIAPALLDRTPRALAHAPDPETRRTLTDCAAALREIAYDDPGDRLLHGDLHSGNVLAADRADWLAIDPKPLAGDPGFDLWPALANRFEPTEVRWRFDALTDTLALDRPRARTWTLARLLQNALWDLESGRPVEPRHLEIARRLA